MSDPRQKLAGLWGSSSRFKAFGNVLTKIVARGVRCHDDTLIEVRSPITAFSGFNGTGKSTLLQLAAAAYACPACGRGRCALDAVLGLERDSHSPGVRQLACRFGARQAFA